MAGARDAAGRFLAAADKAAGAEGFLRVTILDDSSSNGKGVDRIFDAFGATMRELPDVLRDAIPTIRAAHAAVFSTEGAAGRGRWAALAPSTLKERQRLGFGPGPILKRTGALERHVLSTPAVITSGAGGVELRITPAVEVDGVPKYRALAKGFGPLPGRPMVAVGPAEAAKITSVIQRSLRARAAARGL